MKKSVFIITIGPAGSGKGYIIDSIRDYISTKYPLVNTNRYTLRLQPCLIMTL